MKLEEMPKMEEHGTERICLDKMVLLVHAPNLSLYQFDKDEASYDYAYKEKEKRVKKFIDNFLKYFEDDITKSYNHTELYKYHYQLLDEFDIQICPRMGIKHRIKDKELVSLHGTDEDKKNGYIDEYFDSEYGIRIEFNPDKNEIWKLAKFLSFLSLNSKIYFSDMIKVSRIDIAIDYPRNINPCLSMCKRARKNFVVGGNSGVQSVYYGGRGSKDFFRIYNKKKELEEVQKINYTGDFLWRIELEYKAGFKIGNKPSFQDSFNKLHFQGNAIKTGDWKLDCILEKCYHWGMQNALADLPTKTRNRYKKQIIELSSQEFIQPKDIYMMYFSKIWENYTNLLRVCFSREKQEEQKRDDLYYLEEKKEPEYQTLEMLKNYSEKRLEELSNGII